MPALHDRMVTIQQVDTASTNIIKILHKGLVLELSELFEFLKNVNNYNINICSNIIFITGFYNMQSFNIVLSECENY